LVGLILLLTTNGNGELVINFAAYVDGRLELNFLILIFSYILGQFVLFATACVTTSAWVIVRIICYLFLEDVSLFQRIKKLRSRQWFENKKTVREFLLSQREVILFTELHNRITYLEVIKVEHAYPGVKTLFEKISLKETLLRFLFAYTAAISFSSYADVYVYATVALSAIALWLSYRKRRALDYDIQRGMVKELTTTK
ncbi:MAG: hypothetical protein WA021_04695, partial [Minisyncoccia bacterium]